MINATGACRMYMFLVSKNMIKSSSAFVCFAILGVIRVV